MIAAAAAALLAARNLTWSSSNVQFFRGDPVSERNVVMALAEWTPPASVWDNWLLPTYRAQHTFADRGFFAKYVYTHYAPFSELFHWAQQRAGVASIRGLRWAPIALNVAALYCFFLAFAAWRDPLFGLLAMAALALRPAFWEGADGLHALAFHAPQQAMLFGGLVLLERGRTAVGTALAWAAACWQGLLGFEHQLLTLAIIAAFWASSTAFPRRRLLYAAIASGGPLAFALHLAQNALHFGSLHAAAADLMLAAARRSVGDETDAVRSWAQTLVETYRRHRAYVGGTLALPVGVAGALAWLDRAGGRRARALWTALVLGSFGWFALMRSIVYEQIVLMSRVLTPLLALSCAAAGYALIRSAGRLREQPGWRPALALAALAALNVAIWGPQTTHAADFLRREREAAALSPAPEDRITARFWHVQRSVGFAGHPLGLLGERVPAPVRYHTAECRPDDGLCQIPGQTLALAFARPETVRAMEVKIDNRLPDRAIAVRLLLPEEDDPDPAKTRLAAEARAPGDDAVYRLDLPTPIRRRLFLLEFDAPPPRDFTIDRLTVR